MILPYLLEGKWYNDKKKKPVLRSKILREMSTHDKLSKSQFQKVYNQHHYKEVSECFDILRKKNLIEEAGMKTGRGRAEKFYRITEDGLAALVDENITPENFWFLLMSYCLKSNNVIRPGLVDEFFGFFVKKYSKYSSGFSSISHIDQINDMCVNWLRNNSIDGVSSKIIETLASYPLITIDDFSSKLNCSRAIVNRELANISMMEGGGGYLYPLDEYDTDFSAYERYSGMLQRCIAICRTNVSSQKSVCELSLIGIIMYLTLVRHRDQPQMLVSACNRIGYNYRDSRVLPLVFGKWSILRKNLGPIATYNFEVLLNKEARNDSTSLSVIMGGISEFYENMKSIIKYNIEEIKKIHDEGDFAIESAMRKNKLKPENFADIERKLREVSLLSCYDDLTRLQLNLTNMSDRGYLEPELIVQTLCDAFSEEITFLYYFNLFERYNYARLLSNLYYFPSHKSVIYYQVKESHKTEKGQDKRSSLSEQLQRISWDTFTRRKLIHILKEDNQVHKWFRAWISDIHKFQDEASDVISKLEF